MPLGIRPEEPAREHAEGGRAQDHGEDEESEFPAAQGEDHCERKLRESADGRSTRRADQAGTATEQAHRARPQLL